MNHKEFAANTEIALDIWEIRGYDCIPRNPINQNMLCNTANGIIRYRKNNVIDSSRCGVGSHRLKKGKSIGLQQWWKFIPKASRGETS